MQIGSRFHDLVNTITHNPQQLLARFDGLRLVLVAAVR